MVILTFVWIWGYRNTRVKNTHNFITQEWPCSTFCLFLFSMLTSIFVMDISLHVQSCVCFITVLLQSPKMFTIETWKHLYQNVNSNYLCLSGRIIESIHFLKFLQWTLPHIQHGKQWLEFLINTAHSNMIYQTSSVGHVRDYHCYLNDNSVKINVFPH